MKNPIPLFSSEYSLNSILTLTPKGKSREGSPKSIIDLAIKNNLKEIFLVENTMSGFMDAYKNCKDANIKLIFGYKVTVCQNDQDKTEESKNTESKIIVFIKGGNQGYKDLIKIHNHATTQGVYDGVPRLDWATLKKLWTENLILAVPFYNSYIHRNLLYLNSAAIPDFPVNPYIFIEEEKLPFDSLILKGLEKVDKKFERILVKTVYYEKSEDFESFLVYKCILNRSAINKPELSHFGSKNFCLTD